MSVRISFTVDELETAGLRRGTPLFLENNQGSVYGILVPLEFPTLSWEVPTDEGLVRVPQGHGFKWPHVEGVDVMVAPLDVLETVMSITETHHSQGDEWYASIHTEMGVLSFDVSESGTARVSLSRPTPESDNTIAQVVLSRAEINALDVEGHLTADEVAWVEFVRALDNPTRIGLLQALLLYYGKNRSPVDVQIEVLTGAVAVEIAPYKGAMKLVSHYREAETCAITTIRSYTQVELFAGYTLHVSGRHGRCSVRTLHGGTHIVKVNGETITVEGSNQSVKEVKR